MIRVLHMIRLVLRGSLLQLICITLCVEYSLLLARIYLLLISSVERIRSLDRAESSSVSYYAFRMISCSNVLSESDYSKYYVFVKTLQSINDTTLSKQSILFVELYLEFSQNRQLRIAMSQILI